MSAQPLKFCQIVVTIKGQVAHFRNKPVCFDTADPGGALILQSPCFMEKIVAFSKTLPLLEREPVLAEERSIILDTQQPNKTVVSLVLFSFSHLSA